MAGLEWVWGEMIGLTSGDFNLSREISQSWDRGLDSTDCSEYFIEHDVFTFDSTASGNAFLIEQGEVDGNSTTSRVTLSIVSTPLNVPGPLRFVPDGTVILEAKAEVSGGNMTRTVTTDGGPPTVIPMGAIDAHVLGFKTLSDFDIIGNVSGAGEGTKVIDFTAVATAMLSHRSTGQYPYGYGLAFSPVGLTGDSLQDFLPGEGPFHYETIPTGFTCEGSQNPVYDFGSTDHITWDNPNVGRVVMKIQYPTADKKRTLIHERWPSMREIVPAGFKRYEDGTLAPL